MTKRTTLLCSLLAVVVSGSRGGCLSPAIPDGGSAADSGTAPVDAGVGGSSPDSGTPAPIDGGCSSDSDCPGGMRCCSNDGTCNPIVADGGDCDCDHPCATSEGCFPGVCGQPPQTCRPGCNPGDQSTPAQICTGTQNGEPAYCKATSSSTLGGACVPGDNCDIAAQNCPDLPLDRTLPAGPDNPLVPYTCVPAAPGPPQVNECIPAGTIGAGQANCTLTCGNDMSNCAQGFECVQPVMPCVAGEPACQCSGSTCFALSGPAQCVQQCTDPSATGPAPDCANGGACQPLLGNGSVAFATGNCGFMGP